MSATLIIKSRDQWYNLTVHFRGYPRYVEPILYDHWTSQEAADRILDTCGKGVKIVFVKVPPEEVPEDNAFANAGSWGWHNGEQFDHSPMWSVSPISPNMSKMVALDYHTGPHPRPTGYLTQEEALGKTSQAHLYIWNGEKWEYKKNSTPFQRKRTAWRR